MLEQDTQQFLNFFSKIKQETQDASKVLDTLRKTRNDLTIQLRVVQENTSLLKSKVAKNIESLQGYKTYKDFLESLLS